MNITRALTIIAFCCIAPLARSATSVYTTSANFQTAVGGATTLENFGSGTAILAPFTVGGITVTDPNPGDNVALNTAVFSSGRSVQLTTNAATSPTVQFTTSSAVSGFGFDLFDLGTLTPTTLTYALSNGDAGTLETAFTGVPANQRFYGLVSTTPFNSVTLTNSTNGDFIELDNVQTPVPEPTTLSLLALPALTLLTRRPRRLS